MDFNYTWTHLLAKLSMAFSETEFNNYLKTATLARHEGHSLVLEAADPFRRDWMVNHTEPLLKALRDATGDPDLVVQYTAPLTAESISLNKVLVSERLVVPAPIEERLTPLIPALRFENFIVGPSNRFAHAACQAVAENPAKTYNPLVLYGGVGLGKTHLLHAIGNSALKVNPEARIVYITSENFMNEMISVLRAGGDMKIFRDKFRKVDILLVDDIQFLVGKESTQEEFFHTFNDLHSQGKQIVATSDIPPREIHLEERLRNRFEWGLVADIGQPDYETRIAILKRKAEDAKRSIPREVIEFLASSFTSNIRELEGSLLKIVALGSILGREISRELAEEALRDVLKSQARPISMELIQEVVAQHYKIKFSDMKARKRTDAVAFPRQVAMYLSRELTSSSLPEIGNAFGGRDHTTVIHAINKIERKMESEPPFNQEVELLSNLVKNQR
jgi:chromosomal replication initiator protein